MLFSFGHFLGTFALPQSNLIGMYLVCNVVCTAADREMFCPNRTNPIDHFQSGSNASSHMETYLEIVFLQKFIEKLLMRQMYDFLQGNMFGSIEIEDSTHQRSGVIGDIDTWLIQDTHLVELVNHSCHTLNIVLQLNFIS